MDDFHYVETTKIRTTQIGRFKMPIKICNHLFYFGKKENLLKLQFIKHANMMVVICVTIISFIAKY